MVDKVDAPVLSVGGVVPRVGVVAGVAVAAVVDEAAGSAARGAAPGPGMEEEKGGQN